MKSITLGLFLLLRSSLHASPCIPDTTRPADTTATAPAQAPTLEVRTERPGVRVYADTACLGTTPLAPVTISEGLHIIHYVPPDTHSWLNPAVIETVTAHAGEHLVRTVTIPFIYHVTSEPYGATVRRSGSVLGLTPLDLRTASPLALVTVSKEGYQEASIPLTGDQREVHVLLHPSEGGSPAQPTAYLSGEQSKSALPIYITTGATVLTGAAAAYFKIKADNYYDDYRRTGDEGKLSQVRRLDVASGITLAASELSLFTLTYFLLSR
ncbi:MAG TPA: PEGA domain-containing protein [Bacteroidota bacterium]|nr:PEGA domain-containing protein [Bacteroidota bacterium]